MEKIFFEGLSQSRLVAETVALQYLQWTYESRGVKAGRKAFEKVEQFPGTFTEPVVKLVLAHEKKLNSPADFLGTVFDKALAVLRRESVGRLFLR